MTNTVTDGTHSGHESQTVQRIIVALLCRDLYAHHFEKSMKMAMPEGVHLALSDGTFHIQQHQAFDLNKVSM